MEKQEDNMTKLNKFWYEDKEAPSEYHGLMVSVFIAALFAVVLILSVISLV